MKNLLHVCIIVASIVVGMVGIAKAVVPSPPIISSIEVIDASGFSVTINNSSDVLYHIISLYEDESLSTLVSGRVNGIDYDKVGGVASLVENNTIDVRGLASGVYYFFSVSAVNLEGASDEVTRRVYVGSNRSTGIFEVKQVLEGANYVDVGDIDGDGDVDIVGLRYDSDELSWWSNEGGYYSIIGISIGVAFADKFLLLDVDGDDDLDIVCGYKVPVGYFFSPEGKEKSLFLFMNDGEGNFTKSSIPTDSYLAPVHIKAGDIDGDGLEDIIISNSWDRNPVYREEYFTSIDEDIVSQGEVAIPSNPISDEKIDAIHNVDNMSCVRHPATIIHSSVSNLYYSHYSASCWLSMDYSNNLDGRLIWLRNLGDGSFEKEEEVGSINITPIDTGGARNRHNPSRYLYGAFDVGDIDMDGDMDVVAVINSEVWDYFYSFSWHVIYRNDGTGVFSEEVYREYSGLFVSKLRLEDLGGSSDLDFAAGLKEPDGYASRYGAYDPDFNDGNCSVKGVAINYKVAQFWNVNSGESFDIAHRYQRTLAQFKCLLSFSRLSIINYEP